MFLHSNLVVSQFSNLNEESKNYNINMLLVCLFIMVDIMVFFFGFKIVFSINGAAEIFSSTIPGIKFFQNIFPLNLLHPNEGLWPKHFHWKIKGWCLEFNHLQININVVFIAFDLNISAKHPDFNVLFVCDLQYIKCKRHLKYLSTLGVH